MAVNVMMFGGHRDGEILQVPGELGVPKSHIVRLTMRDKSDTYGDAPILSTPVPTKIIDLQIVPRKASTGPAWKIDLPKELW